MIKTIVTSITVTRLGYRDPAIGTDIPDDLFFLSGKFNFLTEADRDEFLDELRQTFELVCPFGCTVDVTGMEFEQVKEKEDFICVEIDNVDGRCKVQCPYCSRL